MLSWRIKLILDPRNITKVAAAAEQYDFTKSDYVIQAVLFGHINSEDLAFL